MHDPRALFHAAFTRNAFFLIRLTTDFNRDTSPSFARSLDVARTFFWIYNPRKPAIIIIPHLESARLTHSASLFRIRKIPSNREDTSNQPTPVRDRFSPRLLIHRATALHSSPQLRALSRVLIQSSRDSPDFCGFVGCDTRASSPLFSSSSLDVLCPFVGLLVYGHRPS